MTVSRQLRGQNWSVRELSSGEEVYVGKSLHTCANLLTGSRIFGWGRTEAKASKSSLKIQQELAERCKENNAENLTLQELWDRKHPE